MPPNALGIHEIGVDTVFGNKHKLFKISKPWGYYPAQVEAAIAKYNEVILQLQDALSKKDRIIEIKDNELREVKTEMHRIQLEMSMLELPDTESLQEHFILTQFKERKTGAGDPDALVKPPPAPPPLEKEVQIIEESVKKAIKDVPNTFGFDIVE